MKAKILIRNSALTPNQQFITLVGMEGVRSSFQK